MDSHKADKKIVGAYIESDLREYLISMLKKMVFLINQMHPKKSYANIGIYFLRKLM